MLQSAGAKSAFRSRSVAVTFRPVESPHRAASRWIWVSTGNAGWPKACAITTLAVLWPTPGKASSASKSPGTTPPWRSTRIRDSSRMFRALAGASPHDLMIAWMSRAASRAMASGVRARAKRRGVTWFTRTSVHWADRTTARSSVYGSSCCSGMGGSG